MKFIVDYNEDDLGVYDYADKTIRINLNNIRMSCDEYKSDFYTLLMHVINHEFLHYLIHITDGSRRTSNCLDNLTHNNQTNDSAWGYWLT